MSQRIQGDSCEQGRYVFYDFFDNCILFQDVSTFRLHHVHSVDDNLVGMAGVLLCAKVSIYTCKRQTFCEYLPICNNKFWRKADYSKISL